jgi:hypothetical protein
MHALARYTDRGLYGAAEITTHACIPAMHKRLIIYVYRRWLCLAEVAHVRSSRALDQSAQGSGDGRWFTTRFKCGNTQRNAGLMWLDPYSCGMRTAVCHPGPTCNSCMACCHVVLLCPPPTKATASSGYAHLWHGNESWRSSKAPRNPASASEGSPGPRTVIINRPRLTSLFFTPWSRG